MPTLDQLNQEIEKIKERNRRVELDKTWELSWTRRIIILILTYATITLFFLAAKLPDPFLNSLVPTVAFALSTSSLPLFKKIWKKLNKK